MLFPLTLDIDPIPNDTDPIPLDLLKQQAEVVVGDRDELLHNQLKTAIMDAEGQMHRTIIARTHRWTLTDFERGALKAIRLPRGRTLSIASIQYTRGGTVQTLKGPSSGSPAGTDYREHQGGDSGAIVMPPRGQSWPSVDSDAIEPVVITFVAGWPDHHSIPEDVVNGVLYKAASSFDNRSVMDSKNAGPDAGDVMLSKYAIWRTY